MNDIEKAKTMSETAKRITDLINSRQKSRIDLLNQLAPTSLDNIPESIRMLRENECAKIRAVMQEQSDLIETIKLMFPDAEPGEKSKKESQ